MHLPSNTSPYHIEPPGGTHVKLCDVPLGDWYPFFMQWQLPVAVSALYVILACWFNPPAGKVSRMEAKRQNLQQTEKSAKPTRKTIFTPMTMFVIFHNVVLAIYSMWAFKGVFPLFVRGIWDKGLHEGLCDLDGSLWNQALFTHCYLFYVSKYYELLDTAIIILKGRRATVLQIYHHAGVILVMYCACYCACAADVFIVWENSGVHSVMYTYYALTAMGFNPPGKQYLTMLQIFQFLFGQLFVVIYMVIPSCQTEYQRNFLWAISIYLVPLMYLFLQFFRETYQKKQAAVAVVDSSKKEKAH